MVDLAALCIALLVVLIVFVRRTSPGVAIFALLAGVLLDQMLSDWVTGLLPAQTLLMASYVAVAVHLLITFLPVIVSLVAVKVTHRNSVLSLLTSLALGFLIVSFGLKIVAPLSFASYAANNSGLLTFLDPYLNLILTASAILALIEMISSHKITHKESKKKSQ